MDGPHFEIHTPLGDRTQPLDAQPLTIGRHADNRVVVSDTLASRFHCVVEKTPVGWRVRDLDSSNGTRLNGVPVNGAMLRPGDIIAIGSTTLKFVDPTAKPVKTTGVIQPPPVKRWKPPEKEGDSSDGTLEADSIEELTEEDLVEEEADEFSPEAFAQSLEEAGVAEEDEPLPLVKDDAAGVDLGVDAKYEQTLNTLADSLPEKPFGVGEISLISARGQTMHAAGVAAAKAKTQGEAVDVLRVVLLICSRSCATDIHVEPKNEQYLLRIRIDGNMVDVTRLPKDVGIKLSALVKILCDIDVTQRSAIQEGHFAARMPSAGSRVQGAHRRVDYRVSFAPAVFGQKLVVRVFDAANAPLRINDLDLPKWMLDEVTTQLHREAGMLLVCGPTGSGKTTSLYALVRSSDVKGRNVVTIEDPVEVQLEGVTQIQVNDEEGKTFSTLLRSVLRQDPDAILVGEIRDSETARTAMQAAITGHLVFSTVHTTNTTGTIFRLLDLGVEPYLIAQGLHVVLAQRLVRQLCRFCKRPVKPKPEQLARMGPAGQGVKQIYMPAGCARCLGTGFAGRRAFFELLSANDELRDTIIKVPSLEDVKRVLDKTHFVRLEQSGYQLVAEGVVTITEIDQAVGK